MDEIEYALMDRADGTMWWYRCLHDLVTLFLGRHLTTTAPVILDAGCGTGGLMVRLRQAWPQATLHGVDLSFRACGRTRRKGADSVAVASVNSLPFADNSLDVIISTDILCHAGVIEAQALAEVFRCLKPGGVCLVNLPAYDWLMADHDRRVHTVRRTTTGRLRRQMETAGLRPLFTTYWNTTLFPLMVLRRKLPSSGRATSDVGTFHGPVNQAFTVLCGLERVFLRRGIALPFGGSALAVAVKP
ncbi:class I SAM-dependent methyltransferase [Azospirillum sp. B4]|uniref:class I SAM-dependent methyltransferase n=1 Tax=Azospirillum sp. B4 TaxID=95605 RepID=UPI00034C1056|nr:class I SAM-dependent methyltransferase [Azospirillum sp. B4]